MQLVKYVIDIITPSLTHIFNLSLWTGVFLRGMKIAKESVLYKSGDRNIMCNYKPISILPVFSEGLEKTLHGRLNNYCEKM